MVEMKEEKHFVINYWWTHRDTEGHDTPLPIRNLPHGSAPLVLPQLINHGSDLCDC